jgi:hypothetical protein
MTRLLDQGDLDAALGRVDVYPDAVTEGLLLVCRCGEFLYPENGSTLTDLVDSVAEHQKTCAAVDR